MNASTEGPGQVAPDGTPVGHTAVPAGIRCIACHYSLRGVGQGPCPECGLHIGPAEIERWTARDAWIKKFNLPRWYAAAVVIPVLYAIGAIPFVPGLHSAVLALIGLGVTSAGTVITSEVLGSLGRPHDRALARRVWFRYAYLVHMPWLVIPGCTVIALASAGIEKLTGSDGDATITISFAGLFAWTIGSFVSLILFISFIANVRHRHALRWTKAQIAVITLATLFQLPFNAAIGFAGGLTAGTGSIRLVGLDAIGFD